MSTSIFDNICPDCNNQVVFESSKTNLTQCRICRVVIHRNEFGRLTTKPYFLIQFKTGIIQPGTTGKWDNNPFKVLGRFMCFGEESAINYWTIQFPNDEIALLEDAYGAYAILRPVSLPSTITYRALKALNTGETVSISAQKSHTLINRIVCEKWEMQEEVYFPIINSYLLVCNLASDSVKPIILFANKNDEIKAFEINLVEFNNLNITEQKIFIGSEKTFICHKCNLKIEVKTYPYAQSCACKNCNTAYFSKSGSDFKQGGKLEAPNIILIPLGAKGIINGTEYEMIGFVEKEELNIYHSRWRECTLYNPSEGFAFLSEFEGHWTFLKEIHKFPLTKGSEKDILWNEQYFNLFNEYSAKVISASGEFPYNIFNNNSTAVKEYIHPPEIIIQEKNPNEGITWFHGNHIDNKTLEEAFKDIFLPNKKGIGAVQPTGFVDYYKLVMGAVLGCLFLWLVHQLVNSGAAEKEIINSTYSFPDSSNQVSFVTDQFYLNNKLGNIQYKVYAPVRNSWFSLNATLVNSETGKEYSIVQGVEYYAGYEGGELWSEGSVSEEVFMTKIPRGNYRLQLIGQREDSSNRISEFTLQAIYDVPSDRNLFFAILFFLLWPAGMFLINNTNEKKRWSNSPFSNFD